MYPIEGMPKSIMPSSQSLRTVVDFVPVNKAMAICGTQNEIRIRVLAKILCLLLLLYKVLYYYFILGIL